MFNPAGQWGVGYAQHGSRRSGDKEHLVEGYYNLPAHREAAAVVPSARTCSIRRRWPSKFGFLLPGVRLQAAF